MREILRQQLDYRTRESIRVRYVASACKSQCNDKKGRRCCCLQLVLTRQYDTTRKPMSAVKDQSRASDRVPFLSPSVLATLTGVLSSITSISRPLARSVAITGKDRMAVKNEPCVSAATPTVTVCMFGRQQRRQQIISEYDRAAKTI